MRNTGIIRTRRHGGLAYDSLQLAGSRLPVKQSSNCWQASSKQTALVEAVCLVSRRTEGEDCVH